MRSSIRVVSIVEGKSVTGPIKPMLTFIRHARSGLPGLPIIDQSLLTTIRHVGSPGQKPTNLLTDAVNAQQTRIDTIAERRAFDTAVIPEMRRVLTELQPGIVETHGTKSHLLFALARRACPAARGAKWIAFHHGYTTETWRVRAYNQLDRVTLRWPDRIFTPCRAFARQIEAFGIAPHRIAVLPNCIEAEPPASVDRVQHVRAQFGVAADERILLTVGRLSSEKGHADLLEAFAALKRRLPALPLRLMIVGDGVEREALQRAAAPLANSVIFGGHQKDAWPFYALASAFVLPSHSEGLPLVLLEAMLAGLPIVATRVGGVPDTVDDERNALLVNPRDVPALAQALQRVYSDAALTARLGAAARGGLARFTPQAYGSQLIQTYLHLLGDSATN